MSITKTIRESSAYKNYYLACIESKEYCIKKINDPLNTPPESPKTVKRYERALEKYRRYLDDIGMNLPAPRFPFVSHDITTWRYLEGKTRKLMIYENVINPEYQYQTERHL